ncbi:MAG: MarR family transcriptional regulator [Acidobacteria bacterium]|nr:MarR family transcriptional regulator [Acidobacteriota bacterium]
MSSGVADALFTRTQQRVLAVLFGNPERTFFRNEIIRRTAAGSGAVHRELARLEASGLVTVAAVGNQKHYQANPDSPIFADLRALVVKTVGVADPLRRALEPLAERIRFAFIYGSVARGEDRVTSDIDVLLVTNDVALEELYGRLAPVEGQLGRRIHPTLYTEKEYRSRRTRKAAFLEKVVAGKRIWLIGNDEVLDAAR